MRLILFVFLMAWPALPFEATRTVDRTSVTLGDPIIFKITATRTPAEKLIFPGADAPFGDFELKDMRSFEEKDGDRVKEGREYKLALFKLGRAVIPMQKIINAKDTSDKRMTDSVEIIVKKVTVADTSDIVDIHPQARVGYGPLFYMVIIGVILALGLIVYLIDRRLKRRKLKAAEKPAIVLPPEVIFEKELAELLAARLLEKGGVKEFHLRISEILRKYLGGRFGFYALESTTTELMAALKDKGMEPPVLRALDRFCDLNDPVKFAKWVPPTEESEKLIEVCREIADKTTPKVTSPQPHS